MAGQTKMIIITSNEDLISHISSNKTANTHIIDLDNDKQMTSIAKDNNNIIHLSDGKVYKRAIDSSDQNRSKQVKVVKKSTNLICKICGDRAIGFNYDVLSCASCKIFFLRNAHQQPEQLKCLTNQDQCLVTHEINRKCCRCRLNRCFSMGMRKDFILTKEENQRRRKHAEENRNNSSKRSSASESTSHPVSNSQTSDSIDRLLMDMNKDDGNIVPHANADLNETKDTLSVEDLVVIQSVQSAFLSAFSTSPEQFADFIDLSDRASALISWSRFTNQIALRCLRFFRQIDEFEGLNADDRFILIKYHLLALFPVIKCYSYNAINDCCSYGDHEEAEKKRQFYMLCGESNDIWEIFVNLILSLVQITEQDQTLISFLLIILLFSQGLSVDEDEPLLNDSMSIHRIQCHYTKVLWTYMVNKQGETKAYKQFNQLLTGIFQIQSTGMKIREFFRVQITASDTVDKIAPLMQAVLHIS